MEIPTLFTDKQKLINFDYDKLESLINSDIDNYKFINNLSVPGKKEIILKNYFKSIILGYNHIFIEKTLKNLNTISNICLPLLHQWLSDNNNNNPQIDNLVIINHPEDAERICKNHIKKTPIFKSFLHDSIISTTDNDDWKQQRDKMNIAFIPKLSLKKIFPIGQERAVLCSEQLKKLSNNYSTPVNMSEFFLHEAQAQLQLGMFGFSDHFQNKTNKKIRDAFSGKEIEYTDVFSNEALKETITSNGPLSKIFDISDEISKNKGNMLIFAFAGHDTTGHTLTWLLYELCKNPKYKQKLIKEIDNYWLNNDVENYDTFNELPFMTKCITETLRLWPALANGTYRELEFDEKIRGIDGNLVNVPKGTYCQIINWTRHRNKELWGDDCNIFNPNRDFKDSEIWSYDGFGTYNISSDRFSPFTYGPRNCIGKNFSHMEMRLILLNIFKNYDFNLNKDQLMLTDYKKYKGINLFTLGPQSIKNDELLGMYVDIIPRKSKI
jgi:benzoate 4-monooxygenase